MENIMVNKSTLIRVASKSTGLSMRNASACIDSIIDTLNEALSRGERVELRGFGSFSIKGTAARKTVFANVPAHSRIFFRPCQKLRETVWNIKDKSKHLKTN
jgi:nucleoid DNA-binding protein